MRALGLLLALLAGAVGAAAAAQPVAVVVHPDVPADDLSFAELRRLFRGDQQFWGGSQRVALVVRSGDVHERRVLLEEVYAMSERRFRQYWVGKVFRSEVASGPRVATSAAMALSLVRSLPGAIALVAAADVPAGARVLRIDGRLPGDRGYALQ